MKKFNPLIYIIFLAALALSAFLGNNIGHLRESQAFYRWILAASTSERLFQDSSGEYADDEIFALTNTAAAAFLPTEAQPEKVAEGKQDLVSQLSLTAGNRENDQFIWDLACSDALAAPREAFLDAARNKKLLYATDIEYADAQSSGVNIFNLLLGFRKVAANFVWVQVDRYWHKGMLYRMLPLMKTVVTLDPNFVDAYLVGSWHLAYNATAKMLDTPYPLRQWDPKLQACVGEKERYYHMAIHYLKDGIRKNPRDYRLYFDLGFAVYKEKMKDYENATLYLSEALRHPHDRWVPRQLYICQELNGQYAEAIAGWQDYNKRFPETTVGAEIAPRFIKRNRGMIFEERMEAAEAAAKEATDAQVIEAKTKAALENKEKAIAVWKSMGESPFAVARLLRLEALDLWKEQRYLEAIALLDKARWESNKIFDEASDMIVRIKEEAGFPLSVSEQKSILLRTEGKRCEGMPEDVVLP